MTELVIVSGKGGTGKTSFAGSLAALADNKVLIDCDVDAADLHLILQNEVRRTTDFVSGSIASIDNELCAGCGICLDYCRFDAIGHEPDPKSLGGERFWIDRYACEGCGVCPRFCPVDAIDLREKVSGQWFISDTRYGPLLHARLGIAQSNSGKLVALLRREARSLAGERDLDLIIIDGPPGIGCPVIASITGTQYLLAITEPSLSGLHDLKRLVELAKHFGIPAGLCVNKYDINPQLAHEVEQFARASNVTVLGRIAYDPAVTKAQVAGTTLIEYTDDGVSQQVRALWERLQAELETAKQHKTESRV